jgi:NADH dehydrogenase
MNNTAQKNIVVIGGGFAGVAAITELLKHAKEINVSITLIDTYPYLLFTPSLYEVATSEEPQKNIAISYSEIFGNRITYVQATVEKIVTEKHVVIAKDKEIPYDYLLLSAGSVSAYHNIPGLQ